MDRYKFKLMTVSREAQSHGIIQFVKQARSVPHVIIPHDYTCQFTDRNKKSLLNDSYCI